VSAQPSRRSPVSKRWATISEAVTYGARSRSRLYVLAAQHSGLFRKDGRRTLVDLLMLDEINEQLPAADLK
jgi:hypothetical protein